MGRKGKGLPGAGKGVWASTRVSGKLVERDGARWRLELGGEGLGGSPGGEWLVTLLSLWRRERRPRKAGVMEEARNPARRGIGATAQLRRREGKGSSRGRRERWRGGGRGGGGLHSQSRCFFLGPMISWVVALHTVLETAEPVTLCWAAVIRSVRLWPDISAARPPTPFRSAAGGAWDPQAPDGPHPPPHPRPPPAPGPPALLPAWGGAQGRAPPPARRAPRLACPPPAGSYTQSGVTPEPRASASAHPLPGISWSPVGPEGQGAAGKMAAPGSSSELSGRPRRHVTRVPPPGSLPPAPRSLPFPFLSGARPPFLLLLPPSPERGQSQATAVAPARACARPRDVVEPGRRAQQEARGGRRAARRVT